MEYLETLENIDNLIESLKEQRDELYSFKKQLLIKFLINIKII